MAQGYFAEVMRGLDGEAPDTWTKGDAAWRSWQAELEDKLVCLTGPENAESDDYVMGVAIILDFTAEVKWAAAFLRLATQAIAKDESLDHRSYSGKIRDMLEEHVHVTGLSTTIRLRNITDPNFSDDFATDDKSEAELQEAFVRKSAELRRVTRELVDKNPAQYGRFSERVLEIIRRFEAGQVAAADGLADFENLTGDIQAEQGAHAELDMDENAFSILRIMETIAPDTAHETLQAAAIAIGAVYFRAAATQPAFAHMAETDMADVRRYSRPTSDWVERRDDCLSIGFPLNDRYRLGIYAKSPSRFRYEVRRLKKGDYSELGRPAQPQDRLLAIIGMERRNLLAATNWTHIGAMFDETPAPQIADLTRLCGLIAQVCALHQVDVESVMARLFEDGGISRNGHDEVPEGLLEGLRAVGVLHRVVIGRRDHRRPVKRYALTPEYRHLIDAVMAGVSLAGGHPLCSQ